VTNTRIAGQNRNKVFSIADTKAKFINDFSFVGVLFKHSILPDSIKDIQQQMQYIQGVSSKITACKSKGEFQKTIENYNKMYKNYESKLLRLVKFMIKINPQETFRFLAACIRGNIDKIKLGTLISNTRLDDTERYPQKLLDFSIFLDILRCDAGAS